MRTITLELLRHGPAHNQLLSPLTPYLALCENHAAETVHVPFEHNQFLYRLDALGYRLEESSRLFQLRDTAAVMGEILGRVPGLTAEANKRNREGETLTHLRLIISSSELALLPFELALSPPGFPGAGQHLLLQSQMPVCLTREIRRSPEGELQWPDKFRILFAAASPPQAGEIPVQSHLLALRRLIQPWVRYYDTVDVEKRNERIAQHLVFLPNASLEAIEEHCAEGKFTHVHILAHGHPQLVGYDTRFFLALHNARDPTKVDYVSGTRLAAALCPEGGPDTGGTRPSVVTLASCDAGNGGSVAGAGSSIAHALHEAGIGMVVAGQFPLTFAGSVRLLEVLYQGLLWGEDPRPLVYDLRRRLHSQFGGNHDWASLTVYTSMPDNFENKLSDVQIERAMNSIEAAMSHVDEVTRRRSTKIQSRTRKTWGSEGPKLLSGAKSRIAEATKKLQGLLTRLPEKRALIHGRLASTEKRQAEILYAPDQWDDDDKINCVRHLVRARDNYWRSFILDRSSHWAVVQYLSLDIIIRRIPGMSRDVPRVLASAEEREERKPNSLWTMARLLSLYDLNAGTKEKRSWAHGNLIELYLLSSLSEIGSPIPDARHHAFEHADQLIDIAGPESFEVYSTRRQMRRYVEWYKDLTDEGLDGVPALADEIFDRFSDAVEEKW